MLEIVYLVTTVHAAQTEAQSPAEGRASSLTRAETPDNHLEGIDNHAIMAHKQSLTTPLPAGVVSQRRTSSFQFSGRGGHSRAQDHAAIWLRKGCWELLATTGYVYSAARADGKRRPAGNILQASSMPPSRLYTRCYDSGYLYVCL